jgi:predicted phage terminase large subunit-like protein
MRYEEPQATGKSLVQLLKSQTSLNVAEIKSNLTSVSKIERARTVSPFIESGKVNLVEGKWIDNYLSQIAMFPNAKHDEHIDLTSYAIDLELIQGLNKGKYGIR